MINLSAAGLNPTEAHVYQVLLSKKEWKPADLAKNVGESRTNMYKILDKLTALELAIKFDKSNKIHYRATNPTRLVQLAQEHRAQLEQSQKELETSTQSLLNEFIKTHEQPGVRFFMGKDDIERVYQDQVNDQKPIYFMLSPKAIDFYGYVPFSINNCFLTSSSIILSAYCLLLSTECISSHFSLAISYINNFCLLFIVSNFSNILI